MLSLTKRRRNFEFIPKGWGTTQKSTFAKTRQMLTTDPLQNQGWSVKQKWSHTKSNNES